MDLAAPNCLASRRIWWDVGAETRPHIWMADPRFCGVTARLTLWDCRIGVFLWCNGMGLHSCTQRNPDFGVMYLLILQLPVKFVLWIMAGQGL